MMKRLCIFLLCVLTYAEEPCLSGIEFLNGIRNIIGADPQIKPEDARYKPFVGSFSTFQEENQVLNSTSYCLTDNHCGHWDAYSRRDVPLQLLSCNSFCYISKDTRKFKTSSKYSITNPPSSFLNCGWETCG